MKQQQLTPAMRAALKYLAARVDTWTSVGAMSDDGHTRVTIRSLHRRDLVRAPSMMNTSTVAITGEGLAAFYELFSRERVSTPTGEPTR